MLRERECTSCASCAQPIPPTARSTRIICETCVDRAFLDHADALDDILGDISFQSPLTQWEAAAIERELADLKATGVVGAAVSDSTTVDSKVDARLCVNCGADLTGKRKGAKTCSKTCRNDLYRQNKLAGGCFIDGCGDPAMIVDRSERALCVDHNADRIFLRRIATRYKAAVKAAPPSLDPYVDFEFEQWLADIPKASGARKHLQEQQDAVVDALDAYARVVCFRKLDLEYPVVGVDNHTADALDEKRHSIDENRTADPEGEKQPERMRRYCRGRPRNWFDSP